jgi:ABC-type antimicrobial peptide transport system permease subunit
MATGVAAAVHELDPELPLADLQPMEDVVAFTIARPRVIMTLLVAFAVMAMLLAGVGVYGVMAYSVGQRTQEIGVRLAMGATSGMVFRMVISQAFTLAAIGVAVGLVVAAATTRVLQTLLYDTEPRDPGLVCAGETRHPHRPRRGAAPGTMTIRATFGCILPR